jgi:hypothetical protein
LDELDVIPRVLESAHTVGIRGGCGLVGAGVLIATLLPRKLDGTVDREQVFQRLFVGMCTAIFFSPVVLDNLQAHAETFLLHKSPNLVAFFLGGVGYFVLRWIAVWLDQRKDKSVDEIKFGRRSYDAPIDPGNRPEGDK